YLNGNFIYSGDGEEGANGHSMQYWNSDGTEDISPAMFDSRDNLLAIYARDYVWSVNQNQQWLDPQITATHNPFNTTTEPVILGDQLTLVLGVANGGNATAENVTITLQADGETVWQQFLSTAAANTSGLDSAQAG
ncbi:MAG: hypothetical protein CXX75_02955, partial [Methanobacteriota archaeon]